MLCGEYQYLNLLNYSHIPPMAILLLLSFLILFSGIRNRINQLFFASMLGFLVWIVFDYLSFLLVDPYYVLWSERIVTLAIFGPAVIALFVYVFPEERKITKKFILAVFLPIVPFIFLLPTKYVVIKIGPAPECDTETGIFYWYLIILPFYHICLSLFVAIKKFHLLNDKYKKQLKIFIIGIFVLIFLTSFFVVLPTIYKNYDIVLFSPFSIVIFAALCAYSIVKYQSFNIKLLGAQALVFSLVILIGSQFFFIQNNTNRILTGITLAMAIGFGIFLIESVKNEVRRKEELQGMTEKLAVANDQLRKLDNAKSEFISIASHQLRTPLTSIKGYASLILEGIYGKVSAKILDPINKMYTSNERLIQLVEELLNVSRIESGRMEFKIEKHQIADTIKDLSDTFSIIAKGRKLYLHINLPEKPLPEIEIDPSKTREVISNLIDNALKYTKRGGVTITAEFLPRGTLNTKNVVAGSDLVRIMVSDTGIGVPKEEIPYLFSKFSRGKDTRRLSVSGTGLGLYVGKNIIESQHGKIWLESEGSGKGTKFIIELPVEQPKG